MDLQWHNSVCVVNPEKYARQLEPSPQYVWNQQPASLAIAPFYPHFDLQIMSNPLMYVYIYTRGDQGSPIERAWVVGWGGDVNVRCEVHIHVEATRSDAVQLSWKMMPNHAENPKKS